MYRQLGRVITAGVQGLWYGPAWRGLILWPLALLFQCLVSLRRWAYWHGWLKQSHLPVPVIVVGNITVGGTGKTPFVIWLVSRLREQGYRPGVLTRGYGGRSTVWPIVVTGQSDSRLTGDESVLLARRCGCPVVAGPDRVADGQRLISLGCDILVSDDGMQHYALGRDIEVVMIDGLRGFGNGWGLPAGPLREPLSRAALADIQVVNGGNDEYAMRLQITEATALGSGRCVPLTTWRDRQVHAVAGIGDPQRFFSALQAQGLKIIAHPFPDHYDYQPDDLDFKDDLPVLMTEKDAVKCMAWPSARDFWYIPADAQVSEIIWIKLQDCLAKRKTSNLASK